MKKNIIIRQATLSDVPGIDALEKATWHEEGQATADMYRCRIETFPEGIHIAVDISKNDNIIGVQACQVIKYDKNHVIKSWADSTDNGHIKNTHDLENGNVLCPVNAVTVHPDYRGQGIGEKLLLSIYPVALKYNLEAVIGGCRIPDYHKYADQMSADEYIKAKNEKGQYLDSELRFYKKSYPPLQIREAIPNYFPDPESLDYGVILYSKNPLYLPLKGVLARLYGYINMFAYKLLPKRLYI